ncbi:receptor-transporting protein 5 [Orycteropus afer afer]|uniref:Receptor-transporting protein 5 n=1 Tax=Orycteropus afer afer TaxID=1230840 RepID=A0A8B7A0D0_ORYAF|nr:receptor-transporting protein 5 [Orycteropus afer afer]
MDRPGADVWATTFHQLMAERKPQDTWVLLPEDSLVAGRLDHGCFQYRLKGRARFQCMRCSWVWGSAHVQTLFHLCWDEDSRQGLVKMRVWGPRCKLCPPGASGDCQVSAPSTYPFLSKLALHVLRRCYGENPGPDQCPGFYCKAPSDSLRSCEACSLGVCFLQKVPGFTPAPRAIWGSCSTYSGMGLTISASSGEGSVLRRTQLLAFDSRPMVKRSRGSDLYNMHQGGFTVPLSVSGFIRNPLTESSHFFSRGEGVITIPFSFADGSKDEGPVANGSSCVPTEDGSVPATDTRAPVTIGKGSLFLSANSMAMPEGKGIPVNIKAPIFHGKGLLTSSMENNGYELKGFIFQGKGSLSDPVNVAKVQGLVSNSDGATTNGESSVLVSYIVGLMANGEGSITFPLSFINIIEGKDSFPDTEGAITFPFIFANGAKNQDSCIDITKDKGKENGGNGPATPGDDPLPETNAGGHITSDERAITSSDDIKDNNSSTDTTKDKGKDNVSNGLLTTSHDPCPESSACGPITSEETVTYFSTDDVQDKNSSADTMEGKEKEDGGNALATTGHDSLLKTSTEGPITFSEGSITIPFSVFNIIRHKGLSSSSSASGLQSNGILPCGYSKKKRLRSRFSKSSCGSRRDEDFCLANPRHGSHGEPYEDVWIWVSMTICVLWLMCMYKLSPSIFQQQA